jgi:GNAT superfamily N-acetyltransferase
MKQMTPGVPRKPQKEGNALLDRTLDRYRIILKRVPGTAIPNADLPEGYSFVSFIEGDEKAWGDIEASVLEFDHEEDAVSYFTSDYLPYLNELKRRTYFIRKETGEKVGTFTAWWNYTDQRRYPFMHWVAVKPQYQGIGLGKTLIAKCVQRMVEIEGDCVMYIPTQTWSHKAIKLYLWAGFNFVTDEPSPGGFENETIQGLPIIEPYI